MGLEGTLGDGCWHVDKATLSATFLLHHEVSMVELHLED